MWKKNFDIVFFVMLCKYSPGEKLLPFFSKLSIKIFLNSMAKNLEKVLATNYELFSFTNKLNIGFKTTSPIKKNTGKER